MVPDSSACMFRFHCKQRDTPNFWPGVALCPALSSSTCPRRQGCCWPPSTASWTPGHSSSVPASSPPPGHSGQHSQVTTLNRTEPVQSYTLSILHTSNLTLIQSYTLPIQHFFTLTLFQSYRVFFFLWIQSGG